MVDEKRKLSKKLQKTKKKYAQQRTKLSPTSSDLSDDKNRNSERTHMLSRCLVKDQT